VSEQPRREPSFVRSNIRARESNASGHVGTTCTHSDGRAHVGAGEWESMPATLDLNGLLRPPGALDEVEFARSCDGCGACAGACPERAIQILGPEYGVHELTPAIAPSLVPCRACPDTPCITACPTGALSRASSARVPADSIRFWAERCWAVRGQQCDYCVEACPEDPPALRVAPDGVTIDEDACTGCGLCIFYCTATPRALTAMTLSEPGARGRARGAGRDLVTSERLRAEID
jgi:ferredoxin-type protein NapG